MRRSGGYKQFEDISLNMSEEKFPVTRKETSKLLLSCGCACTVYIYEQQTYNHVYKFTLFIDFEQVEFLFFHEKFMNNILWFLIYNIINIIWNFIFSIYLYQILI